MQTITQSLLATIRAKPRDMAPRLILADRLEECGQEERAQAIREHILNPKRGASFRQQVWLLLGPHLDQLLINGHNAAWPLEDRFHYSGTNPVCVLSRLYRGYISCCIENGYAYSIMLRMSDFIISGIPIFAQQPLASITISDRTMRYAEGSDILFLATGDGNGQSIPPAIYHLADGMITEGLKTKRYEHPKAAQAALGRACLAFLEKGENFSREDLTSMRRGV